MAKKAKISAPTRKGLIEVLETQIALRVSGPCSYTVADVTADRLEVKKAVLLVLMTVRCR